MGVLDWFRSKKDDEEEFDEKPETPAPQKNRQVVTANQNQSLSTLKTNTTSRFQDRSADWLNPKVNAGIDLSHSNKDHHHVKVAIIKPRSFDEDAQQIADFLKAHRSVVVNFDDTDANEARRITDFFFGTTYALSGHVKQIGNNVFFCAPENVTISEAEEQALQNANSKKKSSKEPEQAKANHDKVRDTTITWKKEN